MKTTPVFGRMLGRFAAKRPGLIEAAPDFRIEASRLTIADEAVLSTTPVNMIRLFALAADKNLEIHPDAVKAVRRNLSRIDKTLCVEPEANALFMHMLTEARDPETALRRMNEAGVLGRFIPEFGKIVAMMQFNMYHHYTVDEHLVRAVGILAAIERGRLSSDHPLSTEIFHTLSSRRALYVAVLLHDIAKGRKEGHSIAGERVAKTLCPRLGLSAPETETVAWLIRHHLLMSETAQMRDLNDFKTILDFANVVQSPERLKLLLILTVADIRAVGPTAWNGWKGQLLRTLYFETEPVLSGGHTSISRKERVAEAQAKFFAHYPGWTEDRKAAYAARHYDAYWLNVETEKQMAHEKLMARARQEGEPVATEVRTDEFTAITEITIHAPDHPRFLALITGACAAANANIVGAQIFTTADSLALDTILIQRQFANSEDERRRAERVAALVRQVLRGEARIKDMIAKVQHPEPRLQAFTVAPRVIIDNESSNLFTIIEVNGLDRVGILYDLTEALFHLNLNIGSAHITTYGERVIDVFYVTDLTGGKILSTARHGEIERRLLAVLAKQKPAEA
jgi:[protein-PII] uridylyltransferase